LSNIKKDHKEALLVARNSLNNIKLNIEELNKIITKMDLSNKENYPFNSLFNENVSDKFIIEKNEENKTECLLQIRYTLDYLLKIFNFEDLESLNNIKLSSNQVLRSYLGVSRRRQWVSEFKMEDLFKLDFI